MGLIRKTLSVGTFGVVSFQQEGEAATSRAFAG